MHKNLKKFISGIISMAMTAVSAAVPTAASITPAQNSAVQILGESTFDNKALPWHVCEQSPAKQSFAIEDGTFHIAIQVPQGDEKERWDLQFRHMNLNFKAGHEYKVSFKVKSNRSGLELCSFIGNAAGIDEYFVLDGSSEDMHMGPDMGGQWPFAALKLTTDWQVIEGIFTPDQDLEACQWTFQYAKGTKYQGNAMEGDEIWFDDMSVECLTCGETPGEAVCGNGYAADLGIITPKSDVRLNQLGYYPDSSKKATYVTDKDKAKEAIGFKVVDKDGETVYTGKSKPVGFDSAAGEYCQLIDFSAVKKAGTYTIVMDDEKNVFTNDITHEVYKRYMSHEFRIGDDVYEGVLGNAMNYFYQNRSGGAIESDYITSGDKAKLAHNDINKTDTAYISNKWWRYYTDDIKKKTSLDVSGGWYNAEDYVKSVPDGGAAVWLLQNMYERSKLNGTDRKWADGRTMTIPDEYKLSGGESISCKDTPDVLDEARYELEFMFRMIVDPEKDTVWGETCGNYVYDSVVEAVQLPTPYIPRNYIESDFRLGYKKARVINPPTYVATLNMIACAAQASRLWKGIDDDFAKECLDNAQTSWNAIKDKLVAEDGKNINDPNRAPYGYLYYDNEEISDDAYWAACELYSATGDKAYYDYLKAYKGIKSYDDMAFGIPKRVHLDETGGVTASLDRYSKSGCGTISLLLSDKTSDEDKAVIKENLLIAADRFLIYENSAMGVPYEETHWEDVYSIGGSYEYYGYDYGSNSRVLNNAMVMAYAYDATGNADYLNGAAQAMDYIFGRNGLGFSYVTGCGTYHVKNPVSEYWVNELDKDFPTAPDGVLVGGPCSGLHDTYVRLAGMKPTKEAPQKSYADSVEAWSVNSTALDWQAAFAWDIAFLEDAGAKAPEGDTTTTTTTTITTSATTTTTTVTATGTATATATKTTVENSEPQKYGDVNCDGEIDMSDVVLIMQALANPDKYGVGGTDKTAVRVQGWSNADVYEKGSGVTTNDALTIQEYLLGKVKALPV